MILLSRWAREHQGGVTSSPYHRCTGKYACRTSLRSTKADRCACRPLHIVFIAVCCYRNIKASESYATLEGAKTLYESFKRSVHQFPTEDFIGERKIVNGRAGPYEFLTFKQVEGGFL